MTVQTLYLHQFKSYENSSFDFAPSVNCIVGPNGAGKSNLLDALHVLCLTKSAFGHSDSDLVRHEQQAFGLKALVNGQIIVLSYHPQKGKKISVGGYTFSRLTDYIGRYPCVAISPQDQQLVEEGSEGRRRFFDMAISQQDNGYLHLLSQCHSLLRQRNALLKSAQGHQIDKALLDAYDRPLVQNSLSVVRARASFVERFAPVFESRYQQIAPNSDPALIVYRPDVGDDYATTLHRSLGEDLAAGRTTKGIHRDDYDFMLAGYPVRRFGSQGQIKTFALALKIAYYDLLASATGQKPLLLLDDIFDKLDEARISALLAFVAGLDGAQSFITDARSERSRLLLSKAGLVAHFIEL